MAKRVLCEEESDDEEPEIAEEHKELSQTTSTVGQARREVMRRKEFGMSLILSNVPRSPKIINGSFAALFETNDILTDYAKQLNRNSIDLNEQPIRLSPRRKLRDRKKQYSFDAGVALQRKSLHTYKQASLDSKIEEIFDSSFESYESEATESECEGPARNGNPAIVVAKPLPEEPRTARLYVLEPVKRHEALNGDTKINGTSRQLCKHCGHAVED